MQNLGFRIGDISHAIGEFVEKNGFNVIKEFQGHGIGRDMHEDPGIPNYGKEGKGPRIEKRYDACNRTYGSKWKTRYIRARRWMDNCNRRSEVYLHIMKIQF